MKKGLQIDGSIKNKVNSYSLNFEKTMQED